MRNTLLSMSLWLFQHILPNEVKDDISGDLQEEYTEHVLPEKGKFQADIWLLKQTLLTCSHHIFTYSNGFALLAALIGLSIFFILSVAIAWLSTFKAIDVSDAFMNNLSSGASHKIFVEPAFWQYIPESYQHFSEFGIWMWIELRAGLYSICAVYFIAKINKIIGLNIKSYALLAIMLMFIPYFWGTYQFLFHDIPLKEAGPIIATMLFTVWYMILPISWQLIKKIIASNSVSSGLLS
ncbi:hypothetical protein [Psychromonas ossibalaenae]|uniref:hypothetical protein n=1 Tax=Psychromonas ossibalaenae TaxID=444922 RepID=UPI000375ABE1|nr:hypothetical protein [Psychromonas ossibalaenae]